MKRVVITGLGVVSALGHDHHSFWDALCAGESGISSISQVDCLQLRFNQGAEVKLYDSSQHFDERRVGYLARFAQFALVAAREAVTDSGLTKNELSQFPTAVITGSCMGGKITEDRGYYRLYGEGCQRSHPLIIPNAMANAGASQISYEFGITGPTYTISTACASSTHAIGQAFWLVRHGLVRQAIAGGSEAPFSFGQLKAWEGMRIVSSDTCRPFSKHRRGLILGEGGAILILEALDSAIARGAKIYAEIKGFGMSSDAAHVTTPSSSGQQLAIHSALNDANLPAHAIEYMNAHGTGTVVNDKVEAETLHSIFGTQLDKLWVNSTKAAHGHLLGATGAIEAVATALAIKHQTIPPTLHFVEKDLACDLPLVINIAKKTSIEYALSNSFAFGGLNGILALGVY
jgi:nodulation protein E